MHAVGLHSALAIKRQRKRRDEQRRAKERRYSSQSGESGLTSPRLSTASLDQRRHHKTHTERSNQGVLDTKVVTSIGMLHVGVVFLVLGAFLLISGILPNDLDSLKNKSFIKWWNELVAIGLFSITVGCFLIILNRIITKKEEDDLEKYVKRQLTRSKSGHRLERDIETGELTTKHAKKAKQYKNLNSSISINSRPIKDIPNTYSLANPSPVYTTYSICETHPTIESSIFLEGIAEEDGITDRLITLTQLHTESELTNKKNLFEK
ncbi:uncharacterized protein LOC131673252 isoform X1 [Phymastichus coffea]|uniref:uncharacterized protein LOC131673252 isoform X1 n=1 Tax=Phymastichus coffea TaxID=108790 RepID=UPI00273B9ECC|nr:uncharacterized protein LOC131673252 isoform X1 [Phymastichus coffea]XP_058807103.1 uncharacterized protein LOC131673252 isoform X1 [Phymastichus coffea]